jgi:tetratricopeptide (TPR) repeat protein
LRFLAEVYSRSNWYGPAYETWNDFLDAGGQLDSEAVPLFSAVTSELGYTAYARKQTAKALEYYLKLVDIVPYDKEGFVWVGRILLEQGKPAQALAYWQIVVDRDVTDERAKYFLKLAQSQSKWGIDAANAFEEGIVFYNENDIQRARERFARAVGFNEMYAEAWAYLGRIEFEQGNYRDALTYYQEANKLEPANETYRYFYEESARR